MYCKNCGSEIAEGAKFCSQCGTPVDAGPAAAQQAQGTADTHTADAYTAEKIGNEAAGAPAAETSADAAPSAPGGADENVRRPSFEEFHWNVSDYPDRNAVEKTEDIDFNWNADPREIPDAGGHMDSGMPSSHTEGASDILKGDDLENAIFGESKPADPSSMSAAERIDKFYTFNRKNEEFQKLLDREYDRVKSGNAIQEEITQAEARAAERFDSRAANPSMEDFLKAEGVVKPYQPKAFESDVLQRIEAQEAEKEAKRLEEEARLAAIEEARKEAEAKKLAEEAARAEEEARIRAEAEAKAKVEAEAARLEEIARAKAIEEERLAEEARIRAEEEAKRRIEEEAKARAELEARQRAEAEARVKAAEEARQKAEADLKAAQEAAKIKAQQEARIAAVEEERFRAEQERRRLADIEAKQRLEAERQKLAQEANQAVAREEARKVLEQTARMREEEAAKIRAAVAGLRAGAAGDTIHGAQDTEHRPQVRKEVQEAHMATKNQINEMARARDAFFAELETPEEEAAVSTPAAETPAEEPARRVTGRDTLLHSDMSSTKSVNKEAILSGVSDDTIVISKDAAAGAAETAQQAQDQPVEDVQQPQEIPDEKAQGSESAADEDDAFFRSLDAAAAAGAAGAGAGIAYAASKDDEIAAAEDDVEELHFEEEPEVQMQPDEPDLGSTQRFSHDQMAGISERAPQETMVMAKDPSNRDAFAANDFDNYGAEEARRYKEEQARSGGYDSDSRSAMDDFYGEGQDDEEGLSKKELKQREKERKRLEKQKAKEDKKRAKGGDDDYDDEEEKGGKGRLVLKIVLVILIIILAAEVAGMAIKFIAPQSKAAEFIDDQLNKVIQLVTGDDTEYSVIAAQVRVEPMEDKTDLINSQRNKNKNGIIENITYNADLNYDQETDGKISDLVLSQPMTQVEWGRDEENYPVYYDEQVVGRIIAFESQRYNLMDKGNEQVLKMIDTDSDLYSETAALKDKGVPGSFSQLEIGEIRQAGSTYFVWVRETIGGTSTEKVYGMYADHKFVLKMSVCYEV